MKVKAVEDMKLDFEATNMTQLVEAAAVAENCLTLVGGCFENIETSSAEDAKDYAEIQLDNGDLY